MLGQGTGLTTGPGRVSGGVPDREAEIRVGRQIRERAVRNHSPGNERHGIADQGRARIAAVGGGIGDRVVARAAG